TPASMKASVTEGPERSAMAAAVRTNSPAPIMAPIPRATSDIGPSVRLSGALPTSAKRRSMDLVRNNELDSGFASPVLVPIYTDPPCLAVALRLDQMKYTGIPNRTIIRPGHVYCGL